MRNRHSRQTLRYAAAALALIAVSALASSDSFAREQDPDVPVVLEVQPNCGSPGDQVTVRGVDFPNRPRVRVGNRRAKLVVSGDNVVTIVMPKQSEGSHTVLVTNRSRGRSAVAFLIPCDAGLLPGNPGDPALEAIESIDPTPAENADIVDDVILTRITVYLAPGATVGEVNTAIKAIGGRIEGAFAGVPVLSVAVPRQADRTALAALAAQLETSGAILAASLAEIAQPDNVPTLGSVSIDHLKRTRFPAAWNALALARGGLRPGQQAPCDSRRVPVIVADHFSMPASSGAPPEFAAEIPRIREVLGAGAQPRGDHGYKVMATLAANFDAPLVGAVPLPECLDLVAFNIGNIAANLIATTVMPILFPSSGKFVVNTSFRSPNVCDGACLASTDVHPERLRDLALRTAVWKSVAGPSSDRFVHATSAGNNGNTPEGQTYPARGLAEFNSEYAASRITNPDLRRYSDTSLWTPSVFGLPNIAGSIEDEARLDVARDSLRVGSTVLTNTLAVGSLDAAGSPSDFSNRGPTICPAGTLTCGFVSAVSDRIVPTFGGKLTGGASNASPQVAGLAAYLWLLSPQLRDLPARDTAGLIEASADPDSPHEIDALTAVLALDAATSDPTPANSPVRLAMLDLDDDGDFDQDDLAVFRGAYLDFKGDPTLFRVGFDRHDLNGDGFVSASTDAPFDLDTFSSRQFGTSILENTIEKNIEGRNVSFPEKLVSDLDVVCFYAHSKLYTGDPVVRKAFSKPCGGSSGVKFLSAQARLDTFAGRGSVEDPDRTGFVAFQPGVPFDRAIDSKVDTTGENATANQTTTVTESGVTSRSEITSAAGGGATASATSVLNVAFEVSGPTTITLTGSLDALSRADFCVGANIRLSSTTINETALSCGFPAKVDLAHIEGGPSDTPVTVSLSVRSEVPKSTGSANVNWGFTLTFAPA